jgi:hypothetical protein
MQRHLGARVAIIPLIIGSYIPDLSTKWFVYGITVFGVKLKADDPAQFHRGWPGAGFTHSLLFGVLLAIVLFLLTRNRIWAISILIGQWAHALTDTGDTVGTMLLFPFTTHQFSIGAWVYAGQTGRYNDAGAYFSGLGFVWDGVWIVAATLGWRILTRSYFEKTVLPSDPVWNWATAALPMILVLAMYRATYFYGVTRWITWLLWAHVVNDYQFDLSWGGPSWAIAAGSTSVSRVGVMPVGASCAGVCCGGGGAVLG